LPLTGIKHCLIYAPYIPSTFRINSWELLELADIKNPNSAQYENFLSTNVLKC